MCTNGRVYVHIPSKREVIIDEAPPHDSNSTVALDPGICTFQTCFDADGRVRHFGVNDQEKLEFLFKKCDEIKKADIELKKKNGKRENRSTWNLRHALRRYRNIIIMPRPRKLELPKGFKSKPMSQYIIKKTDKTENGKGGRLKQNNESSSTTNKRPLCD